MMPAEPGEITSLKVSILDDGLNRFSGWPFCVIKNRDQSQERLADGEMLSFPIVEVGATLSSIDFSKIFRYLEGQKLSIIVVVVLYLILNFIDLISLKLNIN